MAVPDPRRRFPPVAPPLGVERIGRRLDAIDCQELQWWLAVPRLGERSACAFYDVDTGELSGAREVVSTEPVAAGGRDAIAMRVADWTPDLYGDRVAVHQFVCTLEQERARWLAVTLDTEGAAATATEADPGFEHEWGRTGPRRLVDTGRYQPVDDVSYQLTASRDRGAGVYRVRVGSHLFVCLRVIDMDGPCPDESQELGVAFVEPTGRTILYRQYRGRAMNDDWQDWRAAHPGRELVLDGKLFLQRSCTGRAVDVLTTTSIESTAAGGAG